VDLSSAGHGTRRWPWISCRLLHNNTLQGDCPNRQGACALSVVASAANHSFPLSHCPSENSNSPPCVPCRVQIERLASQGVSFAVRVELFVPPIPAPAGDDDTRAGLQHTLEPEDVANTAPLSMIHVARVTEHRLGGTDRADVAVCRLSLSHAACSPVLNALAASHIDAESALPLDLEVTVFGNDEEREGGREGAVEAYASGTRVLLFNGWNDTSHSLTHHAVDLIRAMCFADTPEERRVNFLHGSHNRDSSVTRDQPHYHLLFALLNDAPPETDIQWDAASAVEVRGEPSCTRAPFTG
jgi:hypothetical protein